MDNAIKVAYEFYKKHPKETLIVVTADHETGGLGLGTGKYELHLKVLKNQKQPQDLLSVAITDLRNGKRHMMLLGKMPKHCNRKDGLLERVAFDLGTGKDVA